MYEKELQQKLKHIIKEQGRRFSRFVPIAREILRETGDFEALRGKTVLELGPGANFGLIEYISRYTEIEAVGLSLRVEEKPPFLVEDYLLDFLSRKKDNSVDLIYSRRVMEQHSFEAPLLVRSEAYKRLLSEGPKPSVWIKYPGARLNIIQCYLEAKRVLKPGGIIISHVGNRYMARFHDKYGEQLGYKK